MIIFNKWFRLKNGHQTNNRLICWNTWIYKRRAEILTCIKAELSIVQVYFSQSSLYRIEVLSLGSPTANCPITSFSNESLSESRSTRRRRFYLLSENGVVSCHEPRIDCDKPVYTRTPHCWLNATECQVSCGEPECFHLGHLSKFT